jgi:hypothetical protein
MDGNTADDAAEVDGTHDGSLIRLTLAKDRLVWFGFLRPT